ncbi:hypothetical protein TETCHI1b_000151 [Candidatus Hodgkinia cicadicola]|nr:hypothetical protein TETCHI1b_000151 [Candidatus Hodgkinia cicadicola]
MTKYVEFALCALATSNAIDCNSGSARFVKLAACELISSAVCDLLCKRPLTWMRDSVYVVLTLLCSCSVGIRWNWVGHGVQIGLIIHSVLARALQTAACVRLTIRTLQAYGPSLGAAALSTFCGACGLLAKAAILDETAWPQDRSIVSLILVSLSVCLVCALGAPAAVSYALAILQALLALVSLTQPWSKFTQRLINKA